MPASRTTKGTRNWLSVTMALPVALVLFTDMGLLGSKLVCLRDGRWFPALAGTRESVPKVSGDGRRNDIVRPAEVSRVGLSKNECEFVKFTSMNRR